MAVKYNITTWPTAQPSNLLSTYGGKHIINIKAEEDTWNGSLVGRGDYAGFEYFEEAEAGEIDAEIVEQLANSNFLVHVKSAEDVYFVYNPPVVETEWTHTWRQEKNFYIAAGELMRAHELAANDTFELSADGFEGEAVVGGTITSISGKKPVVTPPASV